MYEVNAYCQNHSRVVYATTARTIGDMNAKIGQNSDNKEVVMGNMVKKEK